MRTLPLPSLVCLLLAACTSEPARLMNPPASQSTTGEEELHETCSVRLLVACEDAELRATAERALARGLLTCDWVVVVPRVGDVDMHVVLVPEPSSSTGTEWVAISLCAVRSRSAATESTAHVVATSGLAFHDIVTCPRADVQAACEALAVRVAARTLEPSVVRQMRDLLNAGESDLIDVDQVRGKYGFVDEKRR